MTDKKRAEIAKVAGTDKDAVIGKRFGVHASSIGRIRREFDIPPFGRKYENYTTTPTPVEITLFYKWGRSKALDEHIKEIKCA